MQDKRPDPDRILHQIQQQEADAAHVRGRLKIFFGYAAGVGKTYAMLEAAHAALAAGTDVVAGYIEPHTRPDTLALLEGLEQLPPLCVEYKNVTLRSHAALPFFLWTSLPIPTRRAAGTESAARISKNCWRLALMCTPP